MNTDNEERLLNVSQFKGLLHSFYSLTVNIGTGIYLTNKDTNKAKKKRKEAHNKILKAYRLAVKKYFKEVHSRSKILVCPHCGCDGEYYLFVKEEPKEIDNES